MEFQKPEQSDQAQMLEETKQKTQLSSLSDGLLWLNQRAWPLTVIILLIAGICLFDFTQQERVPIPFSSVIAVLPALLTLGIFIVVVIIGVIFLPTMILFVSLENNNKKSIIDLWPENLSNTKKTSHGAEFFVTFYCFFMLVYFAAIFALAVWLDLSVSANSPISTLLVLLILAVPVVSFYFLIRKKIGKNVLPLKIVSGNFWVTSILGAAAQIMLMIFVLTLSTRGASGSEYELGMFCLYAFLGIMTLGIVQFFAGSVTASIARSRPPMQKIIFSAAILIILPLMIPSVGAKITSAAFQRIGAGGRSCVILTWAGKDIAPGYEKISTASYYQSKPLRIVLEADGIYRVREYEEISREIYFIPLSAIASMHDCTPESAAS